MAALNRNQWPFWIGISGRFASECARIRDKIAQSKAKGIWMGGPVPLGYDLGDRELLVNPTEAELVREIFELYLEKGSVRALKAELERKGMRSKVRHQRNGRVTGGGPFSRGHLYCLLANPIYIGKLPHKGKLHDGKHAAIMELDLWEKVQALLHNNKRGTERPAASLIGQSLSGHPRSSQKGARLAPKGSPNEVDHRPNQTGRFGVGIGGRFKSESVAVLDRNQWPLCVGMRTYPRQNRPIQGQGHLDGRPRAARL